MDTTSRFVHKKIISPSAEGPGITIGFLSLLYITDSKIKNILVIQKRINKILKSKK